MAYTYSLSAALWYPGYHHIFQGPWDEGRVVVAWCTEQFGPPSPMAKTWQKRERETQDRWAMLDQYTSTIFAFRDDDDAFEFKIRWS